MADFLGNSAGIEGALTDWGNYWGQVDQRARLRYDHREARDEREREHQYQLERGRSNQDAYAGRAGLLAPVDGQFSAMGPRNVPNAPGGASGLTPEQVAGNAQFAEYMTRPGEPGLPTVDANADMADYNFQGMLAALPQLIVSEQAMTPMQRTRWTQLRRAYGRLTRGEMSVQDYRARLEVAVREGIVNPDQLNAIEARQRTSRPHEVIDARQNVPQQQAPQSTPTTQVPGASTAGLSPQQQEGSDDALRALDPDTSGALAATPEMQMLQTVVQDRQRLARLAAAHGRNAEAEQMYAEALQGQAAYLQQSRLVMLRAASQGHRTALADLLGLYSGRPEGTTRLQAVGNTNQYNLQVVDGNGQWSNTPNGPFTIEQLFQTARGLVDREAVMAESEANSEYVRARIAADADIRVASIRALTDQQRMMVDAAIAEMEAGSRERIAQGNAELVVDSANNRSYLQWWERGPDGRPIQMMREIREQDVRVADSNGRRTERRSVGTNVTGINNVTAGGN